MSEIELSTVSMYHVYACACVCVCHTPHTHSPDLVAPHIAASPVRQGLATFPAHHALQESHQLARHAASERDLKGATRSTADQRRSEYCWGPVISLGVDVGAEIDADGEAKGERFAISDGSGSFGSNHAMMHS